MGVRGQYLNANATTKGTAIIVMTINVKPVVVSRRKAMARLATIATTEKKLRMPPEGMKTSSTIKAHPINKQRTARVSGSKPDIVFLFPQIDA